MSSLEQARERIKANSPKEPFALKFKKLSADSIVSECGQFYVGRVRLGGVESFEVWFKAPGKIALHLRQHLASGEDAKVWASSIAQAYLKGKISLAAPMGREEIDRLRATA